MFEKIGIIGDGAMGSICAILLCEKSLNVSMWGYDAQQLALFEAKGENVNFLPGRKLPANLIFESDDSKIMDEVGW